RADFRRDPPLHPASAQRSARLQPRQPLHTALLTGEGRGAQMFFKSRTRRKYEAAARALDAVSADHKEFSIIANAEARPPSARLVEIALAAAARARDARFRGFAGRPSHEPRWFEIWPGEHYRLLAGLV